MFAAPETAGAALLVATGDGQVLALSAGTGSRLWKCGMHGPVRGIARAGGRIFAAEHRERGRAFAVSTADGALRWARTVGAVRYAPAVAGNAVVLATDDGDVLALDAATGTPRWRARVAGAATAAPVPVAGEALVATRTDTLYHLDLGTGTVTARTPLPAHVSATPLPWRGVVLLPLLSGALLAYDPAARSVRWAADLGEPILAAPVAAEGGDAYVLTRAAELWRVPAAGGEPTRLAELGGAAVGSLAVAGGRIFVGRLDGTLSALRADGTVVWSKRLGNSIVAPVAVGDGAIYAPLLHGTIVRIEGRR